MASRCDILKLPTSGLEIGAFVPQSVGALKIAPVTHEGRPIEFMLGPAGSLPGKVPFNPSVFQGTGQESRLGIVFNLPDDRLKAFMEFEDTIQNLVKASAWNSSYRPADEYPGQVRAKVRKDGAFRTRVVDVRGNAFKEWPENWRRARCNAVVAVRGVYQQGKNYGLMLEARHIQLEEPADDSDDPFAGQEAS